MLTRRRSRRAEQAEAARRRADVCGTIISSDDATVICISIDRPEGTVPMMAIPPVIGVILILVGIGLAALGATDQQPRPAHCGRAS